MRLRHHLLLILALQPAAAFAAEPAYYGPMKAWPGMAYRSGYEDRLEQNGSWRVIASTRDAGAVDMALYRAAEHARDMGYAYVEMLGGTETRSRTGDVATLYTRPSQTPAAPTTCRSKRRNSCYTADVAEVLHRLGGADGAQPGVAIVDHVDAFGRSVTRSGFGTGMASTTPPMAIVPAPRVMLPMPAAAVQVPATDRGPAREQLVRGRDPRQGWTISD